MAKSYESFNEKELKALYHFSCLYNQKLSSIKNNSDIQRLFPNLSDWENIIGKTNILPVGNLNELQEKLKRGNDNRFMFAKSGKTILGALLFHLNKAIMVGNLEKKNKSVIITHIEDGNNTAIMHANGIIPLNNLMSFIDLMIK